MSAERILVVEDERIVALNLGKKLQGLGFAVPALAHSGADAIRKAEETRPDLVLMDIRLEGEMDGVEAAAQIRERLRIPVVYLTAYSSRDILERAKVTEPHGYILKPFEDRELQIVIEMALYKSRMERKVQEREQWLAATLRSIGDAVMATDAEERILFLNPVAEQLTGWTSREAVGRPLRDVFHIVQEDSRQVVESPLTKAIRERACVPMANHTALVTRGGCERPIDDSAAPIMDETGQVVGGVIVFRDMTEKRKADEWLRQAQKMEAIGKLAGGVAHDFNNLLTIINGYSDVLLATLHEHDRARVMLEEIHKAGERAAALTGQLLAFSRKQMMQLKVLDLNQVLADMGRMLKRLIGEDVALASKEAPGLWQVKADPNQLEQVLMNLAVNARDAMPTGGRLTLETANVVLDESSVRDFPEVRPGPYVMLAVTDTGTGMDRQTQARIFEPFFTSKEMGKGTGLGLATVYGIVKQTGGHIKVSSELGQGTSFKIYLPALVRESPVPAPALASPLVPGRRETVLLAEDEDAVRILTQNLLQGLGYSVLVAADGVEALEKAAGHAGGIDLLLTDVVMPRMGGRQLAEALLRRHPQMRVLYLSGYTDDMVVRHGVLEAGAAFLQKPWTLDVLARKVRQLLDQQNGASRPPSADRPPGPDREGNNTGPEVAAWS